MIFTNSWTKKMIVEKIKVRLITPSVYYRFFGLNNPKPLTNKIYILWIIYDTLWDFHRKVAVRLLRKMTSWKIMVIRARSGNKKKNLTGITKADITIFFFCILFNVVFFFLFSVSVNSTTHFLKTDLLLCLYNHFQGKNSQKEQGDCNCLIFWVKQKYRTVLLIKDLRIFFL